MDSFDVTLHDVTVGEGVMTVAAHVSLLDAEHLRPPSPPQASL